MMFGTISKKGRAMLPCSIFEIEKIEAWLEDMAEDGWYIKKEEGGYWERRKNWRQAYGCWTFCRGEPAKVKCQLEMAFVGKYLAWDDENPSGKSDEIHEKMGWRYAGNIGGFFVYYSNDPDVRDLYSDAETRMEQIRRMHKKVALHSLRIIPIAALMTLVICNGSFLQQCIDSMWNWIFPITLLIALLWATADTVKYYRGWAALKKRIEGELPPIDGSTYRADAEKRRKRNYANMMLAILLVILIIGTSVFSEKADSSLPFQGGGRSGLNYDPPFATLEDYDSSVFKGVVLTDEDSYLCRYDEKKTYFSPRVIHWAQNIYVSDKWPYLDVSYYETKSDRVAEHMMNQYKGCNFLNRLQGRPEFVKYDAGKYGADEIRICRGVYDDALEQTDEDVVIVMVLKGKIFAVAQASVNGRSASEIAETFVKSLT